MNRLTCTALVAASICLTGLIVGCHGNDDQAPTNTKNSTYIDSGQTAADKIGADRAAAHRPRLRGNGAGN